MNKNKEHKKLQSRVRKVYIGGGGRPGRMTEAAINVIVYSAMTLRQPVCFSQRFLDKINEIAEKQNINIPKPVLFDELHNTVQSQWDEAEVKKLKKKKTSTEYFGYGDILTGGRFDVANEKATVGTIKLDTLTGETFFLKDK